MPPSLAFASATLLLFAADMPAQTPAWAFFLTSSPPVRQDMGMAYDQAIGQTILFGGKDPQTGNPTNETWAFDGVHLFQLHPATVPTAGTARAMVYDSVRQRVVMFVYDNVNPIPTWEYYNGDWHQVITAVNPGFIRSGSMCYDQARQQVFQFGGDNFQFDNWTYDGSNWAHTTLFPHPPGRAWSAMAFDASRSTVVMFGGLTNGTQTANDTWEWNGTQWNQRLPLHSPPGRTSHAMCYDQARHVCVVYGGYDGNGNRLSDTWEWNGTDWTQSPVGAVPGPRAGHAMAFDSAHRFSVLIGSDSNTSSPMPYVYGTITQGAVNAYGQGCAGSPGVLGLQSFAGTVPYIGCPFELQLVPVGSNPSFFWFGFSASFAGSLQLPLDLTAMGMPGCSLLCSLDSAAYLMTNLGNGVGFNVFTVPYLPAALGGAVYTQGIEFDPTANAAQLVTSNGLRLQIGGLW